MELDELRTLWLRQPSAPEPPLDAQALNVMLARQSGGIIERLRRNAQIELGLNAGFLVLALALVVFPLAFRLRVLGALLLPVAGVCLYYFYRKLRLLRGLAETEGHLRTYLARVVAGMRALIRFYYRFSLAMAPVALFCGFLVGVFDPDVAHKTPFSALKFALGLGGVAVLALGYYWVVGRFTAWYLQRLYGRHVDRLEAALHELEGRPGT